MTDYAEFRLAILDSSTVRVLKPPGTWGPEMKVPMDTLREQTIGVLSRYLAEGRVTTREELTVLGSQLFLGLFDDEVGRQFKAALENVKTKPNSVLRLVLEFGRDARDLAELPWEYIYYPDDLHADEGEGFFVAADPDSRLILTRHVPLQIKDLHAVDEPLRILIVVSQPADESLGEVAAHKVIEAIKKLEEDSKGAIVTKELRQPTKESLTTTIGDFEPHVVHFLGHGRYEKGKGGFLALVKDDQGTLAWISDVDLPKCFVPRPRLVFLHACQGAHSDSYEAFRGVALRLVFSRVPAVVAWQYEVENSVAIEFARRFYESLGKGKPIDEAVQDGRRALGRYLDDADFSSRAFGSPVVFLQSAEGIIKMAEAVEEPEEPAATESVSIKCTNGNCPNPKWVHSPGFCTSCGAEYAECEACHLLTEVSEPFCGRCGTDRRKASAAGQVGAEPAPSEIAQYATSERRAGQPELAARPPRQPEREAPKLTAGRTDGQ